jgi:HEAT repeat protein
MSHESTRALEVLGDIGPAAHEAIPAVEEWTKSPIFGQQAREALVRIGKAPSPLTLAELEKLQEDPSRTATMIPRLMATFAKGDEDLRIFAAEALRQLGPKAIDAARAGLKNKNADIRFGCAQTLAFLKTEAAPAIPELLTCVRDKEPRVRYKAIYALGQTGVRSDEFFAAMIEALNDKDESVRDTVLEVFESMDTLPREVAPALAKRVGKDSSYEVRRKVLPILAKTGDHALPTFRELFKNAKHRNSDPATYPDYQILLHGVNQMKPAQLKSLLPELKTQLATIHGSSQTFEPDLVDMLKKCGPDGAKAMAESLLSVKKEFVVHQNRIDLLQAIGSMGKDADVAVPLLIDLLKANTPKSFAVEYRPQVAEALAEIGPGARDAIPAIQAMLKDPAVAEEARAALKRFGVKDKK